MRDPERIDPTLEIVRAFWKKYPFLRLGQIISFVSKGKDPFYIEDDFLRKELKLESDDRAALAYQETIVT